MKAVLASLIALAVSSPAVSGDIQDLVTTPGEFDPFSGRDGLAAIDILVRRDDGDAPQRLLVRPANGAGWRLIGPTGELASQLRGRDGEIAAGGQWETRLTSSGDHRVPLDLVTPASRYADAGTYELELEVVLESESGERETRRMVAVMRVPVRTQANIAGGSGGWGTAGSLPFIDLGEIETGETARAVLQVRANVEVLITATSLNGGRMAPLDHTGPGVPYSLSIDGVSGALTAPLILQRRPPADLGGANYPLVFTVGEATGVFAGAYRDTIEIDVTGV